MSKKQKSLLIAFILWTAFIFCFSLQDGATSNSASSILANPIYNISIKLNMSISIDTINFIIRKIAHVLEFLILGIITCSFLYSLKEDIINMILNGSFISLLVSIIDEIIQTKVDGRSGSLIDVLIDFFGILLATLIMFLIKHKRR